MERVSQHTNKSTSSGRFMPSPAVEASTQGSRADLQLITVEDAPAAAADAARDAAVETVSAFHRDAASGVEIPERPSPGQMEKCSSSD